MSVGRRAWVVFGVVFGVVRFTRNQVVHRQNRLDSSDRVKCTDCPDERIGHLQIRDIHTRNQQHEKRAGKDRLRNIPLQINRKNSCFQYMGKVYHGFIILIQCIPCFGRENGNAVVDVVM